MRKDSKASIIGLVLVLAGFGEHFLGLIQSLDFVKTKLPEVYAVLVSHTTSTALMIIGFVVAVYGLKRQGGLTARVDSLRVSTTGDQSPIQTLATNAGGFVAGRDIVITTPKEPQAQALPTIAGQPDLIQRGIEQTTASLFELDDGRWVRPTRQCWALAIRNRAVSSEGNASNVVAHIDYDNDNGLRPIHINEGWWIEDASRSRLSPNFYIATAQTKRLVLAVLSDQPYPVTVLSKTRGSESHFHFPEHSPLTVGRWRVTIEITGQGFRFYFHSTVDVKNDGTATWTKPVIERPREWPKE